MTSLPQRSGSTARELHGDELLHKLQQGWAPLPNATLMSLVMGGLRVRMMRSIVTMISIVLAIAFLAYTGLTNKLFYNQVIALDRMEQSGQAVKPAEIEAATGVLMQLDLVSRLSADEQMKLARSLDMTDVDAQVIELARVQEQLRVADFTVASARKEFERLQGEPETSIADVQRASSIVAMADQRATELRTQYEALDTQVQLGKWLAGEQVQASDMSALLAQRLREQLSRMIALTSTPGRLSAADLRHFEFVWPLLAGEARHANVLRQAIAQENTKREAAELALRLRAAAVDIDATRSGNPMDTWLIVMAMLTCTVGIANAMLMSVTERFREIGTMKCLGAQDSLVVKLFLLESAALGIVGAAIGIALGVVVAVLAAVLQFGHFGTAYFPILDAKWVLIGSVFSGIALAVMGTMYPALVAARMNPVDALRVDE